MYSSQGNSDCIISEMNRCHESDDLVLNKTKCWIQNVVIDLNLCPFAGNSVSQSKLFTHVIRGDDKEDIISEILYHSVLRKENPGTTVIICPDFSPADFAEYLDLLEIVEERFEKNELIGHVQIAPFHPLFQFHTAEIEDVGNWTNRSPYPIFHILREDEVSVAVQKIGGDATNIWQRNVSLLETLDSKLGREKTEMIMKGEKLECLQGILMKFKGGD